MLPFSIRTLARWTLCACAMLPALASAADKIDFDRQIRPLLADTCFICHGPDKDARDSDLRLDLKESAFADLGGHKAIVPGDLKASELYQRITATDLNQRMPPPDAKRQLTPQQIDLLKQWIEQGATWQQHWAFTPIVAPPLPPVKQTDWPRNAIDRFVLARLEQEGLTPSPEATKQALLRRVALDLIGLPPTLDELDAFLADRAPDAYERAVDRLLASPRYGERMVWEWLDAARYADTNGFQGDRTRPMWPWRDGVIAALNRNQPFDQFTLEQLAGDLLPGSNREQKVASGFHRNHMLNGEGGRIAEESRIDYVIDRVDTTSSTWLGLTLGCSRCHDHKYDPFTQKEYFQLFAYFNNVPESGSVDRDGAANPVLELASDEQQQRLQQYEVELAALAKQLADVDLALQVARKAWEERVRAALLNIPADVAKLAPFPADKVPERVKQLGDEFFKSPLRDELQKKVQDVTKARDEYRKQVPLVMVMDERKDPRETKILLRGSYDKFGDKVTVGVPAQLIPLATNAPSNRLGLAEWLIDPAHPLTARVFVNRQWQHFFGQGLVKTTEDFGAQGERPTHPELLDYLSAQFRDGGWDVKALQRAIVTSSTYRQASKSTAALVERDPQNRWLARGPRYRLSSATIRDQALAASGLLVGSLGGSPVKPYQPSGVWEEMSFGGIRYEQDHGAALYRRSLYTFWRRTAAPTMLFDTATRQVCSVRQSRTNTPLQALAVLNDVTYLEAARALAERSHAGAAADQERLTLMFRLLASRSPSATESQVLLGSLARLREQYAKDPAAAEKLVKLGESAPTGKMAAGELAAWTGLATIAMNLDEVLSKE